MAAPKIVKRGYAALDATVGRVVAQRLAQERDQTGWRHDNEFSATRFLALSSLVSRTLPAELPLSAHELCVFSQNGEDGVLFELCRRISPSHTFVEFGVENGSQTNCVLLADVFGWSGLFIEGDARFFASLEAKYKGNGAVTTLNRMVNPENICSILEDAKVPTDLGILSIDIDGNDYWVWKAIEGVRPAIVIIEYNSDLPVDQSLVQPYNDGPPVLTSSFGSSLLAIEELAKELGYALVHTDVAGVNAFCVRQDVLGDLPVGDRVARHGINYYLKGDKHHHKTYRRTDWIRPGAASPH